MALINTSLPNLVQGVSQQPDTLRFDGQCEDQLNALSSVADGLKKRPNTRYLSELISTAVADGAFVHFINRDKGEKYVLIINNNIVRVFDILNFSQVNYSGPGVSSGSGMASNEYLHVPSGTNPKDVLKALTINDNTFILNTTKKVGRTNSSKSAALTDDNRAIVFIKQADYATEYTVEVTDDFGNVYKASYVSGEMQSGKTKDGRLRTSLIAHRLRGQLNFVLHGEPSSGSGTNNTIFTVSALNEIENALDGNSNPITNDKQSIRFEDGTSVVVGGGTETKTRPDNFFTISSSSSSPFKIKVSDSKSGTALGVVYKEVDSISDLPKVAPNNFRIKVRGSVEDNEDDYYVKFQTNDGSAIGNGGYVEDVGFDEFIQLDGNTLPFKLVNTSPNNFTMGACSWTTKQAGDDNTNPFPSFFNLDSNGNPDRAISNLFFFKNRLGFLSEGSVILSEAGEYFNFFRTTVRTLLDSAPIDVNVASTKVTQLKSAVGFQENLILFGERGQFVLKGGELLTPKTVSITPVTNYETDTSTAPLELGSYVYFPFTRGSFSGVREFTVNANVDTYDSVEITGHVPQYVPSDIMDMAGSTAENVICVVAKNTAADTSIQKDMYVYKYYWEGNKKVLASWSKFTFPFTIVGFDFIESDLFIVGTKSNKTILAKLPMEEKLIDHGAAFNTYLDLRQQATIANGQITLSFTPESDDVIQVYTREDSNTGTKAGALIPCTVNGTAVTVDTSHNNTPVWVGVKYTMSYTFSEQVFRQRANQRKSPSGYQRHFLKGGTLFFDDTASFKVEVTPKARQTYNNVFSSNIVGSTVIGTLPIESGSFSFPIMSSAKDTTIKIVNDSALPSNFQSAEFEAFIHTRSRRV
tara:strand:+ start:4825 stop:7422 length:2598 start_codon:yes stop_codon:yes gene_type:complete